ncbi:MAG: hypothetical protein KA792_04885 [Bacteroidales bacterium]|nr:hypothetical protein [Bacteroidales bacterium]
MIYDCFTFYNELDLLDLRLALMDKYVDKFVIVEADKTFTGINKSLYFNENKDRFDKYKNKIIHIIVNDFSKTENPWLNEFHQRNSIIKGLKECNDDDLIIISDVDEYLDCALLLNRNYTLTTRIEIPSHYYFLNYKTNEVHDKPIITPYKKLKYHSCEDLRSDKLLTEDLININNCGRSMHFTFAFAFDYNMYINKIRSFSHQEYNKAIFTDINHIRYCLKWGIDIFLRKNFIVNYINPKNNLFTDYTNTLPFYNNYIYIKKMLYFIPTFQDIKHFFRIYIYINYNYINYNNPLLQSFKHIIKMKIKSIFKRLF